MASEPTDAPQPSPSRRRRIWWRCAMVGVAVFLLSYLILAYVIAPVVWEEYVRHHPSFEDVPNITHTTVGIPADPINVALVGTRSEVKEIMLAAGWKSAAAITSRSSIKIAADSLLNRPDEEAPVSSLYLYGRKQDLAFEKPVGKSPRQRHHVRFWKSDQTGVEGRPLWVGAATYDRGIGLSHTTGEVTHHIAPEVDAERDELMRDLAATGQVIKDYSVAGFHETLQGRNGGGDRWRTDGALATAVIVPETVAEGS